MRYRCSLMPCVLDHSVLVLLDCPTLFTLRLVLRVTHTLYHSKALLIIIPGCHDPSHGGFYMAEGTLYIRIGLPPRVVSGDRLVSSCCGLTARYLHCRCAYPMSCDWGCTSTCYQSSYVPVSSMQPWGLYLYAHARPPPW